MRSIAANLQGQTYDHSGQIIHAVVIWSCSHSFEGLLTVGINLALVDAVEVFTKRVQRPSIVANQNLESGDLVEVEGTVVTDKRQD